MQIEEGARCIATKQLSGYNIRFCVCCDNAVALLEVKIGRGGKDDSNFPEYAFG